MTLLGRVDGGARRHRSTSPPTWPTAWPPAMPPMPPSSTWSMHTSRGTASTCRKSRRPARCDPIRPVSCEPLRRLDLRAAGIGAVIWATGYGCDFSWIDLPVLDARGEPVHRGGITDVPGLYFIGLQWLSRMNSSFLAGVGDDAARLADHIAGRASVARQHVGRRVPGVIKAKPGRRVARTVVLTSAAMLCFAANSILCRLALAPEADRSGDLHERPRPFGGRDADASASG